MRLRFRWDSLLVASVVVVVVAVVVAASCDCVVVPCVVLVVWVACVVCVPEVSVDDDVLCARASPAENARTPAVVSATRRRTDETRADEMIMDMLSTVAAKY